MFDWMERETKFSLPVSSYSPSPSDAVSVNSDSSKRFTSSIFLRFSGNDRSGVCLVQLKIDGQAPALRYLLLAWGFTKSSSRKWSEQSFEYFVTAKSFFVSLFILEIQTYKVNRLNYRSTYNTNLRDRAIRLHVFTLRSFVSSGNPCQDSSSIVELL